MRPSEAGIRCAHSPINALTGQVDFLGRSRVVSELSFNTQRIVQLQVNIIPAHGGRFAVLKLE